MRVTVEEVTRLTQHSPSPSPRASGGAYRGLEGAGAWSDSLFGVYDSIEGELDRPQARREFAGRVAG